jgi:UPF0755 protein
MTDRTDANAGVRGARKRRTGRFASAVLFVLIVGVSVAGGALWYVYWNFNRPGPLAVSQDIVVPRGAGVQSIGRLLAERGIVADVELFVFGTRLFGWSAPLRAGEYAFPARASARDAVRILQSAEPVIRRLTIPEGLTGAEVAALIAAAEGLSGELSPVEEGALLPETYHYRWGDSRAEMISRMRAAMSAALTELWPARAPDLPLADPRDAVILASIVEKETGRPEERPRVAAVFVNRLKRGMPLQSDPTVAFALADGNGGALDRELRRADLKVDHPYNTYVVRGLPPGPIANPGRASLAAVLNPADTADLYFVADGSGGHAFARTLEEHNRNVAKWRRVQRDSRTSGSD